MSRFGLEDDDRDWDAPIDANASCSDCGVAYAKAEHDPTTWCDGCSDRRDRWAAAYEIRRMAKAVLSIDLTQVKEIA